MMFSSSLGYLGLRNNYMTFRSYPAVVPSSNQLTKIRVGIKKPTQKTQPKKPKKTHLKKPTENVFFWVFGVFFKFLFFYENNTNFSLSNRFFMNK
jgi:hypothetical protein